MIFKDPWILALVPFVIGIVLVLKRRQRESSFRFSNIELFASSPSTWKLRLRQLPFILRMFVLVLFLVSLAGPRAVSEETIAKTEGIDIVLAIDASGSMAAEDFLIDNKRVNRLAIVKDVVEDFIEARPNDRLGLVVFAALAYTVCPLTSDHTWLSENLKRVELGAMQDGTAVGSAIASSISRLKNSKAKSKVVILLTDGVNTVESVDPVAAARAAEAMGIKVYTVGAGTEGPVPFPARDMFGRTVYQRVIIDVDEESLKQIAQITGGKFFRATDSETLKNVYEEIDKLEKVEIEEFGFRNYQELFPKFLYLALGMWFLEIVLTQTIFMKIP